jgi:hypothetical protein
VLYTVFRKALALDLQSQVLQIQNHFISSAPCLSNISSILRISKYHFSSAIDLFYVGCYLPPIFQAVSIETTTSNCVNWGIKNPQLTQADACIISDIFILMELHQQRFLRESPRSWSLHSTQARYITSKGMIALHGISLWHFHVCMLYNPNWFSCPLFFSFLP